ncbi:hypothetical protein BD310DRAFT_913781 [Dichomitus squalens]|uniref:Uncharacterized protein n=1 Tax=Dichomitus squalens TaxID=114155 RepID=A0A4Q9QBK2_9APHY|nr:hypothetical protein BD310DRAFT_913781 [Dichomitus squalens]
MASQDVNSSVSDTNVDTLTSPPANTVEDVAEAVAKVSLQDQVAADVHDKSPHTARPLKVYTRNELLYLSKSSLVNIPNGMPHFKDWFGDWNEQVGSKKESEASTTPNARDRRFRRDADDGDVARPSFRSGLSQPSQMGNFRHQPIRTTDRTGDKDLDRERERDLRDREGQERLRNLSDKFDRDRLALSSASNLRNKERDAAPHLSGASTARLGQTQGNGRRGEGRDVPKRKAVESSDDWRRGAEPSKAGRDERTDPRRDRDARERPRSRVRDTSRARREPSTTRRDREDKERPRDRRTDGDRDDRRDKDDNGRRDRDDYPRRDWDDSVDRERDRDDHNARDGRDRYDHNRRARDRDTDRDLENDARHWRDDGRRDERIATRREREARERGWDRFEDRDRERPSAGDDRDARTRRGAGRDRRLGGTDDNKDREDRRDRDKDREAEPAWMETYVPTTPGGGILGGKGAEGELDGIQAFKKGMKEKERKEKGDISDTAQASEANDSLDRQQTSLTTPASANAETPMDEIQLFKLMMKREAEKKEGDKVQNGLARHTFPEAGPPGLSSSPSLQSQKGETTSLADPAIVAQRTSDVPRALLPQTQDRNKSSPRLDSNNGILASGLAILDSTRQSQTSSPSFDRSLDASRAVGPRSGPGNFGVPSTAAGLPALPPVDLSAPANAFNPPAGSRVLALKSRVPSANSGTPPGIAAPHAHPLQPSASGLPAHLAEAVPNDMQFSAPRITPSDSSRGIRSFSPLSNGTQPTVPLEDLREHVHLGQMNEGFRRASGPSAAERAILGLPGEGGASYGDVGGPTSSAFPPGAPFDPSVGNVPGGVGYAPNKGSRFAKFFDQKTRDVQGQVQAGGPRLTQQVPNMPSAMSHSNQRQDSISLGGMGTPRGERTMEDIFAMLQSSAQHRVSPHLPQPSRIPSGGGHVPQSTLELHLLQQQQLQQQQLAQNRLDSLYESRLDDRNFVPDGLVPGLRPAPPRSRSRGETVGVLFNEQIDDPLHFNIQRLTQQRNLEQMYNAPLQSMYNQQQGGLLRNGGGIPMQQGQFRGPSPISAQNPLQPPSQRLPPGLANLGGRPPHDPSQYLGSGVGIPGGGLHGASPAQQVYNTFTQGGLGFNGNPPMRGPSGPQAPLSVNQLGGVVPNNIDLRAANQAQLLGLAQGSLGGGGMRGSGPGFGPQHGGPGGQLSHVAMRQQLQQQQLPPHLVQQLLPSHLQQQGISGGHAQTTQDLMALLMGGHRE